MVFRAKLLPPINSFSKWYFINAAKTIILTYQKGPNEIALNKYLINNYKVSLIKVCLYLLGHCNLSLQNQEVIMTFKNKFDDDLACLITYGSGKIHGSDILNYAFGRR